MTNADSPPISPPRNNRFCKTELLEVVSEEEEEEDNGKDDDESDNDSFEAFMHSESPDCCRVKENDWDGGTT